MNEENTATTPEALPEEEIQAEEEQGTTSQLFGETETDEPEEAPLEETAETSTETEEAPAVEEPKEEPKEEPTEELHTIKVDGEERQVTLAVLKKGFQTDEYLTKKGQAIAHAAKSLENSTPSTPSTHTDEVVTGKDEYYKDTIEQYIPQIKKDLGTDGDVSAEKLSELEELVAPLRREKALNNVSDYVKENLGQDDFKEYFPKIEAYVAHLPLEERAQYDELGTLVDLYTKFKFTDPIVKAEGEAPAPKVPRPAPPIPPDTMGGSGVSVGTTQESAEKTKAFDKARETGDWMPFYLKYPV